MVLVGSVTVDGQVTQLEVRALDVTNGSPVGLPFSATGQMDQLATQLDELVADVVRHVESAETELDPARRIPVEASMAYARGLDYEKRGRRDVAARLFERALQLYPRHDQARSALDRLRGGRQ